MPPFLEIAVPAAEEDDGGDGAQQKQQEEEGTLDAVGSQQDEESRGDHGAGEAGAARGGAGGRRHRHPRGAHAGAAGTGERGSARHARRSRPAPSPMAEHPAPAALREWARAAGSAGHDSADGDEAGTWRRGASPLPPRGPRPRLCAAPGRSPAGDAAGGEEQRCCRRGHPGPAHRPAAAAGLGIPESGARGAGRGRGARAAAAAARGGREWGAAAGARRMTSRPGCGSAGARTWLRRLRRRPRAALGPERPAPSRGAARPPGRAVRGCTAGRLSTPRHLGLPPLQSPSAELPGSPASGGAEEPGGNCKALAGASRRCCPNLPPPRAPPRGWGFGGCSRVSYCLRGSLARWSVNAGKGLPWELGSSRLGGPPVSQPL